MLTIEMVLAAALWSCSARAGLGQLYTGTGPTKDEAQVAVLAACHVHHPLCVVTKCTQIN